MGKAPLLACIALAVGGVVSSSANAAAGAVRVTITGQDHHPRVGRPWHYVVRVTDAAGRPVVARIHLQFFFGALPVGEVGRHTVKNGVWSETFGKDGNPPFPPAARGESLVLRATVTALGQTRKAGWAIVVR